MCSLSQCGTKGSSCSFTAEVFLILQLPPHSILASGFNSQTAAHASHIVSCNVMKRYVATYTQQIADCVLQPGDDVIAALDFEQKLEPAYLMLMPWGLIHCAHYYVSPGA